MTQPSKQLLGIDLLTQFQCVGDRCVDTCCSGWDISVDDNTLKYYRSQPDLKKSCTRDPSDGDWNMTCDAKTGLCVQHEAGLCNIIIKHGEEHLSDTCYLYPRLFTRLGDSVYGSMLMSCPEIAQKTLFGNPSFTFAPYANPRVADDLCSYLPEVLAEDEALAISRHLLEMAQNPAVSPDQVMARIAHMAFALENPPRAEWKTLVPQIIAMPDSALAKPEPVDSDITHLLQTGLIIAIEMGVKYRPRLYRTIRDMERALGMELHWERGDVVIPHRLENWQRIQAGWKAYEPQFDHAFRNWMCVQFLNHMFPFSGRTKTLGGQGVVMSIRYATVKLAVMCALDIKGAMLDEGELVRIVQSLSRSFDHIMDLSGCIDLYNQYGWYTPARLSSLFGFEPKGA